MERLRWLTTNTEAQQLELERCRRDVVYWATAWCWTYDPRLAAQIDPTTGRRRRAFVAFDLFPRQIELLRFLEARADAGEDGLVEKSRDIGFTWVCAAFAAHRWLFFDGFKTTFGSRKAEYVDQLGDPDSIFEKIRMLLRSLPDWMLPRRFIWKRHSNHMRLRNPGNGNTIRGEAGDNMGRGGRSSIYFIDEAAFIDHADTVDAATSANADVRIWGSSVNGMGNLFARKRFGGDLRPDQVFRFHWSDDPRKDAAWARERRGKLEEWVWASEYDIDYSASVEGICIPAKWVQAAVELHSMLAGQIEPAVHGVAGGDIGDGKARSTFVARFGPLVPLPTAWGQPDSIETAYNLLDCARTTTATRQDGRVCKVERLFFDTIGVGKGVLAVLKRKPVAGLATVPINVGEGASRLRWPDGEHSDEKFVNLKAELWAIGRDRFKAAYDHWRWMKGIDGGAQQPLDEIIVLDPKATQLIAEISLPKRLRTEKGKIILESKDQLAKRGIASPDFADALMLTFCDSAAAQPARKTAVIHMQR